jgi:hypothetical protein
MKGQAARAMKHSSALESEYLSFGLFRHVQENNHLPPEGRQGQRRSFTRRPSSQSPGASRTAVQVWPWRGGRRERTAWSVTCTSVRSMEVQMSRSFLQSQCNLFASVAEDISTARLLMIAKMHTFSHTTFRRRTLIVAVMSGKLTCPTHRPVGLSFSISMS